MIRLPFVKRREALTSLPLCAAVLLLSACATQPPATGLAQLETPQQWQSELPAGVTVGQNAALADWWQQLQDPLLDQLIEQTLANNPDIDSARVSYRRAQLQLDIAGAGNKPTVGVSTGVKRSGTDADMSTAYSAGLSASWEVDLWGNIASERSSAAAGVEQASAELRDAQVSLIADTASAYTDLRLAQENRQVAEASIAIRQESYDLARWQYEAGLITELEVVQAKTLLDQTRAEKPRYRQAESEAINRLRALVGGRLEELLASLRQSAPLPSLPQQAALALPADTLRQRPDVKAKEYAVLQQAQAVVQAKNQRYPSFTLSGSLSGSDNNYADVFDVDNMIRSLAASLSYTLFDSGVLKTNERTQQLDLEKSLNTYRSTLLTAQQEVENALAALSSAQQQKEAYDQAEASARLAEELARFQYDAGLLDFSKLLDAQSDLLNAQNDRVQNDGALLSDWIQLYRTAGGGWQGLKTISTADKQGESE